MADLNRRGLLMAAPASIVATALPAVAEGGSPIIALFNQWADLRELSLSTEGSDFDEMEKILSQADEVAESIAVMEAITARDLVAKIVVDTIWNDFPLDDQQFAGMVTFAGLDGRLRSIRAAEDAYAKRLEAERAAEPQPAPAPQPEAKPKTPLDLMHDAILAHAMGEMAHAVDWQIAAVPDAALDKLLAIQPQSDEERDARDAYFARMAERFAVLNAKVPFRG